MADIILAAVDIAHPDSCDAVIREAKALADAKEAELHLCYVLPYGFYSYIDPYIPHEVIEDTRRRAQEDLDKLAGPPALSGIAVKTHLRQGGVHQQILLLATEIAPDTIVINAAIAHEGRGTEMGPVTSQVARYATCKVLIVR